MITALSALAISASAFAADMKVGYVDISYIMSKSPQRVAITEKLKGEFKEQEEELKALLDEYKKLQEKAQKDGATMSEQERIDMSRQAQEMEGKLKLKQNALNEDMKRRGQEEQRMLAGKIMEQINELLNNDNYFFEKDSYYYGFYKNKLIDETLTKEQNNALKLLDLKLPVNLDQINKKYKKLVKIFHPDVNGNNKEADNKFKEINESYKILLKKFVK